MSLADKIRAKTQEARQRIEEQSQTRIEQANAEAEEFLKRTKRIATNRYKHVTQLIEGAASEARNSLTFPSPWVDHNQIHETEVIFTEVAKQLREDGFKVEQDTEVQQLEHAFTREHAKKLFDLTEDRVILTISW